MEYFKFKKLFIAFACSFGVIGVFTGVFSLLGLIPMKINGQLHYGITGLLGNIFVSAMATVPMTFFCFIFLNIGVFIFNLFTEKNER